MTKIKNFKLEKFFIIAIIISLAFENFQLLEIAGGAFKPTQVIAILSIACIVLRRGIVRKSFMYCIAFLVIPLFPLYRINDMIEFLKTYLSYAIIVMFVCLVMPHLQKVFCTDFNKYLRCFNTVIAIVCVLGIVQFLMMNLFGIFFLDGVFGPFEFHPNLYGQEAGMYRAFSLFHEPSYFGWVCDIALAINLAFKNDGGQKEIKRYSLIALIITAIFMSLSSSAIWIMVILLALNLLMIKRANKTHTILALAGVVVLVFVVTIFDFSFVSDSMSRLFTETNVEGTSAYERLVTPFEYIKKTMENYPLFGRGMGQEGNVDAVGIIGKYPGVHNSIFGAIVTLGLTAIAFYTWIVSRFFGKRFKKLFHKERILLFVSIFGMYFSTGAFISFDTFIFTAIILLFVGGINYIQER